MTTASDLDLPEPAADLDPLWLQGAWYVLVSNDEFWRERTHPRVDCDALTPAPDGRARMLESRRFRARDWLGRVRSRVVVSTNVSERPGDFCSRGVGSRWLLRRRSIVALIGSKHDWTVIWSARSNFGAPPGLSIHTRDPWIPQALLDDILARVRAHSFLGRRCEGLFAPVQDWIPPRPYDLAQLSTCSAAAASS
jgi:hypothetical protein